MHCKGMNSISKENVQADTENPYNCIFCIVYLNRSSGFHGIGIRITFPSQVCCLTNLLRGGSDVSMKYIFLHPLVQLHYTDYEIQIGY